MRKARTPHEGCGSSREGSWRQAVAGFARALLRVVIIALAATLTATVAQAQDPSLATPGANRKPTSFPKGSIFGKVNTKLDHSQPMRLQGDQLIYDKAGNRVIARGNVEIYYDNYILTADEVVYDQSAGTLTAIGNVTVKEPQGNVIHADRYTLTDDFRDGFVQSLSVVSRDNSHITADRAIRRNGNVNEFENGKFTPCKSDGGTPPLWCISASRIIHDAEAATLTYQDAYFQIYGQPVFWLPYFQTPDPSVKRKSGFLSPEFGNSTTLGFITGIPYYYALAPNADFTFSPVYMSKQGELWKAEWRHRLANGEYTVNVAGIDQNANDLPGGATAANEQYNGWRGSIDTKGLFSLSSWWKFGWDAIVESDDQFRRFYNLDSILVTDRVNQVYLIGQSDRNYFSARLYQFGGLLLNQSPQTNSSTHPIIDYNYVFADPVVGGELKWNTHALSFTQINGATVSASQNNENVNGVNSELNWRRRFTDAIGISYTPFADVRGDVYQFDNYNNPQSAVPPGPPGSPPGAFVASDTLARGIVDGGATVSYPWVANTPSASHIVEPIGQIVAHQESVTQRQLPNLDAQSLVFDDTNLFSTSKFSGYDRTEMGTTANVGVQYTFQSNNGGYARFLAGESYHLSGDNVYFNPGKDANGNFIYTPYSGLATDRSDYVLGAYLAPIDAFRIISQSRFDQSSLALQSENAALVTSYGPVSVETGYSYDANGFFINPADPTSPLLVLGNEQEFLGQVTLRLTDRWSVGGTARYNLESNGMLYDSIQAKYADECFVLTASYIESNYNNGTIVPDHTFLVRFELKDLGGFQSKTDALNFNLGGDQRTQN